MGSKSSKLPCARSSSSQTVDSYPLPLATLIRISDRLQQIFSPDLAKSENLQNHVNLKYRPLVEFKRQMEFCKDIQLSGSLAELMYIDFIKRKDNGQLLCESDIDYLKILDSRPVHTTTEQPSAELVLDTSECSPGYTRIKDITTGEYMLNQTDTLGKPSDSSDLNYYYNEDRVPCYRCSKWDDSISGLLNKQTPGAWPTTQQLKDLEATPILLVHKIDPARNHKELTQYFRFSFSLAEKLLCSSLPHCFRYIYLCTKLILKYFCAGTELKSYYIKTTLFHFLVEHYNEQERFSDLPGLGVLMLTQKLKVSFVEGHLSNFFVPEMNLIGEVEGSKRQKVIVILGDILSQPDVKISDLNTAVTVQDYRKFDQALIQADQARDIMTEALRHENQERTLCLRQAIQLLKNGRRTAPNVVMISLSLAHAYLLCEETEKAAEIQNSLNRMSYSDRRFEVVKLERRHRSLFSSTATHALCQITQPVYLRSVDYDGFVKSMYLKQTNLYDDLTYRRQLEEWLDVIPALRRHRKKTNRDKLFKFCLLALHGDVLEQLDSRYTNEAHKKYEQLPRYVASTFA